MFLGVPAYVPCCRVGCFEYLSVTFLSDGNRDRQAKLLGHRQTHTHTEREREREPETETDRWRGKERTTSKKRPCLLPYLTGMRKEKKKQTNRRRETLRPSWLGSHFSLGGKSLHMIEGVLCVASSFSFVLSVVPSIISVFLIVLFLCTLHSMAQRS
mmetsp:Transcript_47959/g.94640  ORF Transcript_47959/g.94640 Transcript_47959/m.94640 type:complete len:157 (+) Transcript_47959:356-826(+)